MKNNKAWKWDIILADINNYGCIFPGREIFKLASGLYEPGYYEVQWNASQQSSGIYFVKIIAGNYISTQKLMLVK